MFCIFETKPVASGGPITIRGFETSLNLDLPGNFSTSQRFIMLERARGALNRLYGRCRHHLPDRGGLDESSGHNHILLLAFLYAGMKHCLIAAGVSYSSAGRQPRRENGNYRQCSGPPEAT
jgi:hypothetical protein